MQFILYSSDNFLRKELASKCPTLALRKQVAAVAAATNSFLDCQKNVTENWRQVTCFAFWQQVFMFESITTQDLNEHKKFILWNLGIDLTWHMPTQIM